MFKEEKTNNTFKGTNIPITVAKYNTIRMIIFLMVFGGMVLGDSGNSITKNIIILGLIYLITAPKKEVLGKKTPFGLLVDFLGREYKAKKDMEIYRAITQLKNLAIAQREKPIGADFLLEQLGKFTVVTKPIFTQTISLWRLGKEEEACNYFAEESGTKLGKEFSNIISKLDNINPAELVEQLELYQNHVKEERTTKKLKRQETISNVIFLPIVATAFVIMLNFVAIVVWMDSINSIINL